MIRTLRITSMIAAVLAAVFLILPAVYGVRSNPEVEQFLGSAGVMDEFAKARGQKRTGGDGQTSPLVKQAEQFALYLNPPAKPEPVAVPAEPAPANPEVKPIAPVSAKFELIGTSVHSSRPELSLALIDEPGTGLYWVRQGSKVGHLVIDQVKDGSIIVLDGQKSSELVVKRDEQKVNLVKSSSAKPSAARPVVPAAVEARPMPARRGRISPATASGQSRGTSDKIGVPDNQPAGHNNLPAATPEPTQEEAELEKLIANLKEMAEKESSSDQVNSPEGAEAREAAINKMISDLRARRVDSEEAKRLSELGNELQAAEQPRPTPDTADNPPAADNPPPEPNTPQQ
jgi:hypothetical protein